MTKEIIVNVGERETRIAVLEDGKLFELHIEREERVVGSLFKARVDNILPGMDAAFVDIGLERRAFLYVGDVLPSVAADLNGGKLGSSQAAQPTGNGHPVVASEETEETEEATDENELETAETGNGQPTPRQFSFRRSILRRQQIKDVLKVGQEIVVQVIKGPRGTKGARVSTRISLPGRYLVLMPEADNVGVSRKIDDSKERERLKKIGAKLREPGFGIILRTEAEDKTEQELRLDRDFLIKLWQQICEKSRASQAPAVIHRDLTLVYKAIRDIFGSDVNRLAIDDPAEYESACKLLDMVSPELKPRVHLYSGNVPIFDHFNLEAEIERLLKRKIWLRSGGHLTFDETEALTTIDVNTGKFVGTTSLNETIVRNNLEAVNEIARQLRLRDIGGIIVIDFIDMSNPKDRQQVVRSLEQALRRDRSRTKISHISPLGLIEMTRKRTAETITDFLTEPCPYCSGRGHLSSPETVSVAIEREINRQAANQNREAIMVICHPDVAEFLIGPDGATIERIEREVQCAIYIRSDAEFHLEKYEIRPVELSDMERKTHSIRRAQVVECRVGRSRLSASPKAIGWMDGYLIDLNDGQKQIGQRAKVRIDEVRRSYAVATVVPGAGGRPVDKADII